MLRENLLARLILLLLTRLVRGNLGGLRARDVVFLHVSFNLCGGAGWRLQGIPCEYPLISGLPCSPRSIS